MRSRRDDRECRFVDSAGIRGEVGVGAVVSFAFDDVLVDVERSVAVVVECDDDPWCYHVLNLQEEKKREYGTNRVKEKAFCVQ